MIADIRDASASRPCSPRHRPHVVYPRRRPQARAPDGSQSWEAIANNVLGTASSLERAERLRTSTRFVLISTDKAVNPTNMMGATKRLAENWSSRPPRRAPARVLRRRALRQRPGQPRQRRAALPGADRRRRARHRHPSGDARYFMTIPEAVAAGAPGRQPCGKGGEIFVLDMGEPVRIVDLARDMIRLAGLREGDDMQIHFTGLRPGEKLFEEIYLDASTTPALSTRRYSLPATGTPPTTTLGVPTFPRDRRPPVCRHGW